MAAFLVNALPTIANFSAVIREFAAMSRAWDGAQGEVMIATRLEGLDEPTVQRVIRAARALGLGRGDQAAAELAPAIVSHPNHPEVLRLHAGILNLRGDFCAALATMQRALRHRPKDALYHNTLGTVLGTAGEFDLAIRALQRACELDPGLTSAWYNLGLMLKRCVRYREAAEALRRAVALAPANMDARSLLGDMLRVSGRVGEAAAEYRKVLDAQPWTGLAWWGLADLRTGALKEEDIESMCAALRDHSAGDDDRIAIGFALAKALDEHGRFEESLSALQCANAIARMRQHWNAMAFSAGITSTIGSFSPQRCVAPDAELGREVVFIVGLPRSGTTLVEQILASHSQVEGAGELPDLPLVLAEESRRQGKPFPQWVPGTRPVDWRRMGERYLERTAHWRQRRPVFTDKLPGNWMYIGAIRAMLPGARIVVCRRDPLETCFSCYRQHMVRNEYNRTPEDLTAFWRDFDRCVAHFANICPFHIYQHGYEALLADAESGIRKLLAACGLAFEEACLYFNQTEREVRSPSASQVRRPLHPNTARAQQYGALLDPFRVGLGLRPWGT